MYHIVPSNRVFHIFSVPDKTLPYSLAKIALELVGNGINKRYLSSGYRLKESHRKLNFDED